MTIKPERDADLIRRYLGGEPIENLCSEYFLTRSRIYQILKNAGVPKKTRYGNKRDQVIGVNLTEEVKDVLRAEAARRGLTVSTLSSDLLREMLIACGYKLEAEKVMT